MALAAIIDPSTPLLALDGPVDLIQQRRQPLHFVDDDPVAATLAPQFSTEQARIPQVGLEEALIEKIEAPGAGKVGSGPGALAHAAEPEQEEALGGRRQQARVDDRAHHVVIIPGSMTTRQLACPAARLAWRPRAPITAPPAPASPARSA